MSMEIDKSGSPPSNKISEQGNKGGRRSSKGKDSKRQAHGTLKLENIIDGIKEGFIFFDSKLRYVFVNKQGCEILGKELEALVGKTHGQVFPNEKHTVIGQAYSEALATQLPIQLEYQESVLGRWFETRLYPSQDGLSVFFKDITERKQAEEDLRLSEGRLRLATEAARMFTWEFNIKQRTYHLADNFEQIVGFSPDRIPNRLEDILDHFIDPNDLPGLLAASQAALQDHGVIQAIQFRIFNPKTQEPVWLDVNGRVILDNAGEPAYIYGVAQNVTSSKRREAELRESERKFSLIYDKLPFAALLSRPNDQTVLSINDAFANVFGIEKEKAIGQPMLTLGVYPDAKIQARIQKDLRTRGVVRNLELDLLTLPLGRRSFITNIDFVNIGDEKYLLQTFQDITGRKEAERRLILLAEVSELTRNVEDPNELMYVVSELIGEHLHVRRCLFNEIDLENDLEFVHRDYSRGVPSVVGIHKLSEYSNVTTSEMQSGKTVVNRDAKTDPRTAADYERTYKVQRERAYVAIPLMREHRWVASLWVSDDQARNWSLEEITLLETIAERTWTVIEKLRINSALRESEERLLATFNTSIVGLGLLTLDARFVEVNEALCRMLGYSKEELLKLDYSFLVYSEDQTLIKTKMASVIAGELPGFVTESRFLCKDGSQIWIQNSMSIAYSADAQPQHLIVICQDVSEQKKVEEQLRAGDEEIRALFEVSPVAIFVAHDPEATQITGNPAAYQLLNMPHQNQNVSKTAPEEERPSYRVLRDGVEIAGEDLPMQRAAKLGIDVKEQTLELEFDDGSKKYIYSYARPLFDENGQPRGAIASMLDITERRKTEQALRDSESLYRAIARSIPGGGVYVIDKDLRYLIAEGSVTQLFGLSREVLEGHTVAEVLAPEHIAPMTERLRRTLQGESLSFETEHHGRSYWSQQVPLQDSVGQVMILTMDITERKMAEAALRASEERQRFLVQLGDRLRHATNTAEIQHTVCEMIGKHLSVDRAYYAEVDMDAESIVILADYAKRNQASAIGIYLFEQVPALADVLGTQKEVVISDSSVHFLVPSRNMEDLQEVEMRAVVGIPVVKQGKCIFALVVAQNQSRQWDAAEIGLLKEVAERTADVIENMRAKTALGESEERMRMALNAASMGSFIWYPHEDRSETDAQMLALFGLQEDSPLTLSLAMSNLVHPDFRDAYFKAVETALDPKGPGQISEEILVVHPNGEEHWLLVDGKVSFSGEPPQPARMAGVAIDITARKQVEEQLRQLNLQLESRVQSRTADLRAANQSLMDEIEERHKAELALQESQRRLQMLSQRLVDVQEEERRAIARELHDRVGQTLSALNINMIIMRDQLSPDSIERVGTRLSDAMQLVAETIRMVRDVMADLRPAVLDDYGLEAALQSQIDVFVSRYGIPVHFQKPEQLLPRLGSSVEMTFLRITQEALINIARHAEATHVKLTLYPDQKDVVLTIEDNGIGIDLRKSPKRPGSHGLTIMRERAEAVGGSFGVASSPGQGTKVEIRIKVNEEPTYSNAEEESE